MRIGVDFDNTVVCYDTLFYRAAVERGLVPPDVSPGKQQVRDSLRRCGKEDAWTELQGLVYGSWIEQAPPFAGVIEFFQECRKRRIDVAIISHKTRQPVRGPAFDLHEAARNWLRQHGLVDAPDAALVANRVFFEETKQAKLERIARMGCTHFIDDLPEFLAEPGFPPSVERILFDARGLHAHDPRFRRVTSWHGIMDVLASASARHSGPDSRGGRLTSPRSERSSEPSGEAALRRELEPLLVTAGLPTDFALQRLSGGGNNRVYHVDTASGPVIAKRYFSHPDDLRDRLATEYAFIELAWNHGLRTVPQPLACDRRTGWALYEFIPGRRLQHEEITEQHIAAALAFLRNVNALRETSAAQQLSVASEACFSLHEHLETVERRLNRLQQVPTGTGIDGEAARWIGEKFAPAWTAVLQGVLDEAKRSHLALDEPLHPADRVLSPSDFGFHNALLTDDGDLRFLDFEYAGWDDPAKLVCDFFCQVQAPVPMEHFEAFLESATADIAKYEAARRRTRMLFPVYRLKWCCIVLNDFLPAGNARREFSQSDAGQEERKRGQLEKARRILSSLENDSNS